jgi:hypothetical protein
MWGRSWLEAAGGEERSRRHGQADGQACGEPWPAAPGRGCIAVARRAGVCAGKRPIPLPSGEADLVRGQAPSLRNLVSAVAL